jgi:hypothetical protein
MRLLLTVLATAALAVALQACGTESAPAAPPSGFAPVTFHRTGGFAGVDDRVKVYRDRRVTVRHRTGETQHRRLSVAAMKGLRRDLAAAHLERPLEQPGPSGCADCFIYDVASGGHSVHVSEDNVPERVRPLLARLSRLAN